MEPIKEHFAGLELHPYTLASVAGRVRLFTHSVHEE